MEIRTMLLDALNPAAYNPRKDLQSSDDEYQDIKRSLDAFGLVQPLVWNKRTGNLVGGHQRLKVLKDLGETKTKVSVVDLDDEQERALNLALNKITGAWDERKLLDVLDPMTFDVRALAGFDVRDMKSLIHKGRPEHDTSPQLSGLMYRVVVDVDDERAQAALMERLAEEGFTCHVLIS